MSRVSRISKILSVVTTDYLNRWIKKKQYDFYWVEKLITNITLQQQ